MFRRPDLWLRTLIYLAKLDHTVIGASANKFDYPTASSIRFLVALTFLQSSSLCKWVRLCQHYRALLALAFGFKCIQLCFGRFETSDCHPVRRGKVLGLLTFGTFAKICHSLVSAGTSKLDYPILRISRSLNLPRCLRALCIIFLLQRILVLQRQPTLHKSRCFNTSILAHTILALALVHSRNNQKMQACDMYYRPQPYGSHN
mmetsp:Transcript_56635/g.106739  ORF Transcript_56635/g.106739 Transcript_56635/m.106739 type:complete len:203 (+) Transcript_56635:923-1531(+)